MQDKKSFYILYSYMYNHNMLTQIGKQQMFFSLLNPLPDDKFKTLPNSKSLQTTISNLTKMAESYPNG